MRLEFVTRINPDLVCQKQLHHPESKRSARPVEKDGEMEEVLRSISSPESISSDRPSPSSLPRPLSNSHASPLKTLRELLLFVVKFSCRG